MKVTPIHHYHTIHEFPLTKPYDLALLNEPNYLVLQLQGNAEKALEVVSKLLEEIQLPTKNHQSKPTKYIALCHRRLGVLYKVAGRRQEAERSIREYIKVIQEDDTQPTLSKDLAYAYALLSSIIDDIGGRSKEALAMDKLALELTAASNV